MVLYCKNFEAWISIDGEEAQEFQCEVLSDGNNGSLRQTTSGVTCWIPSQEQKSFKVHWRDIDFSFPSRGRVYIDGIACGGKIIHDKTRLQVVKEGFRIGPSKKRPFLFQKIDTIEPADAPRQSSSSNPLFASSSSADIGKIFLEIHRVNPIERRPYSQTHTPPEGQYTEEETKGKVHRVGFGEPISSQNRPLYHETETIGPPVARFCFCYAPLGLLRAKNIAPLAKASRQSQQLISVSTSTTILASSERHPEANAVKNESDPVDGEPDIYLRDVHENHIIPKCEPEVLPNSKRKNLETSSDSLVKRRRVSEIIDLTSD
ncbi:hypothetical protein VKT23_004955 [Stygiomarasmius scandens]|uniref:DUF7918 domain-containing protein n=1 Tax=Marasmiellus scandens TaxID=2682957 RepID=A0ABR1JY76_9AGAR